jgi:hypothetical protein
MKFHSILLVFTFLIFLPSLAISQPILYNPVPEDGSYIPVGAKNFTININSSNLNTSSVFLYMRAEGIKEWESFQMSCENYTLVDWICDTLVPLGIVGSDTVEYYYFEAKDLDGNVGYHGTNASPLQLTVDGRAPLIEFLSPANQSWVGGIVKIVAKIQDSASGVNATSVFYSVDNQTWEKMEEDTYFSAEFNSSQFADNQSVNVSIKASDLVNNTGVSWIPIKIDNEKPKIEIIEPEAGKTYSGIILLKINVSDTYSGINFSKVSFSVNGITRSMDCGTTCTEYLDTSLLADGEHEINFSAYDNAENVNLSSVKISTQNIYPGINIDYPPDDTFTSKNIFVNVSIVNPSEIVQYVQIRIKTSGYMSEWINMSDKGNYNYYYFLDISTLQDGEYEITIRIINTLNYPINSTIKLTIDRENPEIDVTYPEFYVKGEFNSQIIVTDSYKLNLTTYFEIENYTQIMNCVEYLEGKKTVCSLTFNSSLLSDGKNKIKFYASDLAGNKITAEKEISVDNDPPLLQYLKIEPLFSDYPTTFKFLAYLEDEGSLVRNVSLFFTYPNETREELKLENISSWEIEKFVPTPGIYYVDMNASDLNDNYVYLEKTGYFYIGSLICGDGICQEEENYCICALDCEAPVCESDEVVDCGSGIPTCIPIEMKEESYCGDGICFGDENCSNCEIDCGKCLFFEGEKNVTYPVFEVLKKTKNLYWILVPISLVPASILVFVLLRKVLLRRVVSIGEVAEVKKVEEIERCKEFVSNALLSATKEKIRENVENAILYLEKLRGKIEDSEIDRIVEILNSALNLEPYEARKKLIEVNIMLEELEKIIG